LIALPLSLGLSVALGLWLLPGVPWSVLPLLAYVLSVAIHGNAFVSAFVCGIAYSGLRRSEHVRRDLGLIDDAGFLLTVVMWFAFGALTVVALRNAVPWGIVVVFCLLALTLVRMLAVLAALLGSHFTWPERLLPGWSGPRRTTSIGFGALAFNVLSDEADRTPC
jgi:NhaP-type Na+/H+ or K+/H+ antiporter